MTSKTIKKLIPLLAVVIIFPQTAGALATINKNIQTKTTIQDLANYAKAKTDGAKEKVLIQLGGSMIDRRISALNHAKDLINNSNKLDQATKKSLISTIDGNINNLTSLETDIKNEAGQDLTDLKKQVRSIISDFRIYLAVLPQIHGLAVADRIDFYLDKLSELSNKINDKLPQLGDADTSEIDSLISQADEEITAAEAELDKARDTLNNIQVSDPTSAGTLKKQARQDLGKARESGHTAKQLLRQAVNKLKQLARSASVQGTGYLYIKGNGTVTIEGNGTVSGTTDNGATAVITDTAGDANVDTNGQGNRENLGSNQTRYTGFGSISVNGTNFQAKITGSSLEITAQGTGTATMTGSGSYKTTKDGELKIIPTGGLNTSI